jgi:hypothetical protein
MKTIPRAIAEGALRLGTIEIACAVLEGGIYVVSERAASKALKRGRPGHARAKSLETSRHILVAPANLSTFIPSGFELETYQYRTIRTGAVAHGILATAILDVCDVWTDAFLAGVLHENQERTAREAILIGRAFSRVGIIAAINEATGYEKAKGHDDYQRILDQFLLLEPRRWRRQFDHEVFRELHRIYGWPYEDGQTTHPSCVARQIKRIYQRLLGEAAWAELQRRNRGGSGRRRARCHQLVTEKGIPVLAKLIAEFLALAKGSSDPRMFETQLRRVFPLRGDQLSLGTADMPPEPSNDEQPAKRRKKAS